jgi:SAM-dependent methyltransferase
MDINEKLEKLETTVLALEKLVTNLIEKTDKLIESQQVELPVVEYTQPEVEKPVAKGSEFQELIALVNSTKWPCAVDPKLICDDSDQDKADRAEGILDLIIDIHLEKLKFLDYGCGEGHVVNRSRLQNPRIAVGYDIKKLEKWEQWEKAPNVLFTDDWAEAKNIGPYNIILMYDVLDHMAGSQEELINHLKEIKNILAPNGKIYVRTHPWCSRHGTHLYHSLNKAFAHIVFTEKEIEEMGYKQDEIRKIKLPIHDYSQIFASAGLRIHSGPHQIKESVELFFTNTPSVANRIRSHYKNVKNTHKNKFPLTPLENQFIDYILM